MSKTGFKLNQIDAKEFVKDASWFRDNEGRYILFRGVNFAGRSKAPPYLPILPLDVVDIQNVTTERVREEISEIENELDLMKRLGFNIVRLLVMWKAIEPTPNPNLEKLLPEGEKYLNFLRQVIDALFERGLLVILDFHQDIAHEIYGGDGFPDWALSIDDKHKRPTPADFKDAKWGLHYYDTILTANDELVRHTLASFWKNKLQNTELSQVDLVLKTAEKVRTHLEKTIGATARFFKKLNNGEGHPAILGYELFNEPHPVGIDKLDFERKNLSTYYINTLNEIRKPSGDMEGDDKAFVFVEPRMDWTTYSADGPEFQDFNFTLTPHTFLDVSNILDDKIIFSFHYYDPWTLFYSSLGLGDDMNNKKREWPNVFDSMCDEATSLNLVPFLTEFGGSNDWESYDTDLNPTIYHHNQIRAYMDLQFKQIERKLLNATYWNYNLYNTVNDKDNWNLENFSLLGPERITRNIDIVARPYPIRSSAKPSLLFFDLESKHFVVMLKGTVVDSPTIIYVPSGIHYPLGFEVRATSVTLQWDDLNQYLFWLPDKNQDVNQLIISPPQSFDKDMLPDESLENLNAINFIREFGNIVISYIEYNPEEKFDVKGEYVLINNFGKTSINMNGWKLNDLANHEYLFPSDFNIEPGGEVRIWTEHGTNNGTNLYWNRDAAIWNNSGDLAILWDDNGFGVSSYSYDSKKPASHIKHKPLIKKTVIVKESDSDVDTEIDIKTGDEVSFQASGYIWAGVLLTGKNNPKGWNNIDHNTKFPLHTGPTAHPYCLIGKLDDDEYFFIGEGPIYRKILLDRPEGRLFLRINDDTPGNGNGEFICNIQVWR